MKMRGRNTLNRLQNLSGSLAITLLQLNATLFHQIPDRTDFFAVRDFLAALATIKRWLPAHTLYLGMCTLSLPVAVVLLMDHVQCLDTRACVQHLDTGLR